MNPEIRILHLVDGAKNATGLTVVIDVCRAFSTAAFLASRGTREIFTVGTIQEAFRLRERLPGCHLVGEVKGRKPEGFDLGNSPSEILASRSVSKSVIQRTSAGTQGIINAGRADEILTGAFVNAGAIVRYIQKAMPRTLSFVCMGWEAQQECEEDTLCAEFLSGRVTGKELNFAEVAQRIRQSATGERFRSPAYPWLPEEDLDLCLSLDVFDFVLRCDSKMATPRLQPMDA
ncbi:MAG: 2-phosphosulfolactate phosphatase [Desulfobacteraceae bacterium]|nr:MAG: 2-phosphosulfolactate phosphatase [Desulfobacteraceae bacterium]